jgi:anti-sigma regulatory factor (Ser/Thr protein kinase)
VAGWRWLALANISVAPLDPKALLDHPEIKGIGIHLIRRITDEVHYQRVGDKKVLTLVMKQPSAKAA